MEITLEKIDLVKDRTGCTYAEAKEALEKADGSVVDAIIAIEDKTNKEFEKIAGESLKDSPIFMKMKELVEKGNVSRIIVSKGEKTVVNFPVTAGVIGTLLVPWGAILGVVAAMGAQCSIDFVDEKGNVVDIDGKVVGIYDKAKGIVDKGVGKAQSVINDKEAIDEIMNTVDSYAKKAGKTVKEILKDASEALGKAADAVEEGAESVKETVEEAIEDAFNEDDL